MGMMFADVRFDDRTPTLSSICSQITEICALPVFVVESSADDTHELDTTIAFKCAPDVTLESSAYRPGAVAERLDAEIDDAVLRSLLKSVVQGANEPPETPTVHLRGYVGQERTLIVAARLALESLGGTPLQPISDEDRAAFGKPITETEFKERRRAAEREVRNAALTAMFMLPVLLPLWAVGITWFLISLPFQIWRGVRAWRRFERQG